MMNKIILVSLIILLFSCTEKKTTPFTFVQLCDTQLGMGGYAHDVKSFRTAVQQINSLNPDFVVICGDLVNNPNDSSFTDFKNILSGFNMNCYPAPGNHDVGNIPNDTSLIYYRKTIGKDYYKFQNKGYSFIVTNSQLWKVYVENESERHDKWFKETLKESDLDKNPVVVIGHYPLYLKSPEEEENYFNLPIIKRKEILKLFKQYNVCAYLSGHRHETIINNYENIQLVSGETTSKNFDNRPLGFRLWKVSSDSVTQQFVSLQPSVIEKTEIEYN